jgi:hypothetical protein
MLQGPAFSRHESAKREYGAGTLGYNEPVLLLSWKSAVIFLGAF